MSANAWCTVAVLCSAYLTGVASAAWQRRAARRYREDLARADVQHGDNREAAYWEAREAQFIRVWLQRVGLVLSAIWCTWLLVHF